MRRLVAVGLLSVLLMVVFGGCNLFSFTAPSDSSTDDNLEDGRDALRDGDYVTAIEKFEAVLEDDPNHAFAHWGLAKAYFRQTGFTSITVMSEISAFDSGQMPFMTLAKPEANALYQGAINANIHLREIFVGNATNSELYDSTIALDFTGTLAIQTILTFRDTDVNDTIDSRDLDMNAFLNGSDLDLSEWDQIDPAQQAQIDGIINSLLADSAGAIAALDVFIESLDTSLTSGFDTDNLSGVLEGILDGFNGEFGGGGRIASYGGASTLHHFSQGGSR
ncbi:hypothetical protein KQI63_10030 [bacterium]|nr:hypothetical protein [bacterium]